MASPAGGRITPLPSNESYQSPFDGRWVDTDEAEVFRLIDMQRERISGTHEKAMPVDGKCGKLKMHETKLIEFNPTKIVCACGMAFPSWEAYGTHVDDAIAPNPFLPSCLNFEDIDDSSQDVQPQVGDYGLAVRENAHGQEEIPFHIEREEHTGLPVALLNMRLYAKPEDDIEDGQYVSLLQLHLDGYILSRTGRRTDEDE